MESVQVGGEPFYAIPDGSFLRHVEAAEVDRQVLARLKDHLLSMKDVVVDGVAQMIGSDDPFSRAAIEKNIENMDQILDLGTLTEDMRMWLWMSGFRVTVDVHGEVVHVELPGLAPEE